MCDIFPEVQNCCLLLSLRIGMIYIAVIGIVTGGLALSIVEQLNNASFDSMKNITEITDPKQAYSRLSELIPAGATAVSVVFMLTGVILLLATLSDQEGFVQIFVWVTFAAVLFGFVLVLAIAYECAFKEGCIFGDMDWLSSAITLILITAYLFVWIYFIIVANSYVLQAGGK